MQKSQNPLENVLNSKFAFKLTVSCKCIVSPDNKIIFAGLDNGTLCVFSVEKFEFILTEQILDGAIINIEPIFLDHEKTQSHVLFIQGKEGEIVILSYNLDTISTEILLRWRDSEIVGFTKVSTNNKIWTSQELFFNEQNRTLKGLDDLKFFYPDNNEQLMLSFSLSGKDLKKQEIMLPPPKAGGKEISICCVKYIAYENQGNLIEHVLTAEENSRLGIISVNQEKFTKSKFKELYQHKQQSYAYFILPYQIVQENGITILKLIVGLNIEDTIMLCIDLQNLQVISSNIYQFSSALKPGITNGLVFREGKYLLISTSDYKVKILRTKDFKQIVSLTMHDNYVNGLLLTKSDENQKEYLVSCSEDKDFCILDFSSLKK